MGKRRTPGLYKRKRSDGSVEWYIDKRVKRYGRLHGSTGTSDEEEAKRYLARRLAEIREALVYGVRPRRKWRDAATRYLTDFEGKKSIDPRVLVLNDVAQSVIEEVRGQHRTYVLTPVRRRLAVSWRRGQPRPKLPRISHAHGASCRRRVA